MAHLAVIVVFAALEYVDPAEPAPVPVYEVIEARAVDGAMLDAALQSKREREAAAERAAREAARRAAAERLRIAAEREAEEQARREAEEQARREAEEQARREAEEQARREAEEQARREAEEQARREAEEQARREAEEQARREAALRAELEAEEAARRAAAQRAEDDSEIGRYVAAIVSKVQQNFVYPSFSEGLKCILYVKMRAGGQVVDARVAESSGDPAFDRQAVLAVRRASPLPVPDEPRLFVRMREMKLVFDPS